MPKILASPWFHLTLIGLLTAAVYSNIFQNSWFDDDYNFIVEWQATRSWSNLPSLLAGEVPLYHEGIYRPLRSVWYLLAYSLWGLNLTGYHAVSLAVHLLATALIYLITRKLIQNNEKNHVILEQDLAPSQVEAIGSRWLVKFSVPPSAVSLLTALFFATHPLHVDGITFIASSFDLIGVVFMLGSLLLYLHFEQSKPIFNEIQKIKIQKSK